MENPRLYLFLILSVLLAACASDEAEPEHAVSDFRADSTAAISPTRDTGSENVILFLGNSLSAGYGIGAERAFPALIQQRIDSLGLDFRVVNAGLSGETTSGGLRRIDWLLRQPVSVLVLELGGNDGLRGVPLEVTRSNLEEMIEKARARYPDVEIVLAGMQIPPNLGHEYTSRFRAIYPRVADSYDTHLIPFLLEGVGGVDSLMQSDGIHPTAEGHRILAENVWDVLEPLLMELQSTAASRQQSAP